MTLVLDAPDDPLLVGGTVGGAWAIDARSGISRQLLATGPALDAAASADRTLWVIEGVRAVITGTGARRGEPSQTLVSYPFDGGPPTRYGLPVAADAIATGRKTLWTHDGRRLLRIELPIGSADARSWEAPSGQRIAAVAPDVGSVFTITRRSSDEGGPSLTCHSVTA
jgi:hypothetical protein